MATAPARDDATAHFYVRNLDASVGFYVNTLGFDMVRREETYAIVTLGASIVRRNGTWHGMADPRAGAGLALGY